MELPQTLKDLRNVVAMFGHTPRVDEDIIDCIPRRSDGGTLGAPRA